MLLRLVMVGAVASLGLSLPSGRDLERWSLAAQAWWGGRLSDWQYRSLYEEDPDLFAQTEEPKPSEPKAPEAPAATEAPAAAVIAQPAPEARPIESLADQPATFPSDEPIPSPATVSDDVFNAIVGRMAASFGTPLPAALEEEPPAIAQAPAPAAEPKPEIKPEPEPLMWGQLPIADEFDLAIARLEAMIEAKPDAPTAPTPDFDPFEIEQGLAPVVASAPTGDAEKPAAPAESTPAPEAAAVTEKKQSARGEQFATAVKLTGQAVQAWMSLLMQGQAVASAEAVRR